MPSTATETKSSGKKTETFAFQAETRQLLDIVIHSLYSNKEIFLRELISNASDALDRLRFEALTDDKLLEKDEKLEIRLETDPEKRTLSVIDNGIGMSRQEVIDNIGTIAKSGTRELMARLAASKQSEVAELIGQFGVGFYSAFMVADRVTLVTRRAGEETATRWESSGDGEYTLSETSRFMRGTTVTLHLKPVDADNGIEDFTDFHVLQRIVKRYSDFVAYPITMEHRRQEPELDEAGKPIPGKFRSVVEEKTLNSMKPIWTRPRSEVQDEEYAEFYKHIAHDWNEPLDVLSLHAEGRIEYQALLFLPSKAPFDLYYRDQRWGLQLYVRRVLIMDHCEELLPPYLRFVKGVVDSPDLPLNVSREMIQQDRHIAQIKRWLTRKVIDHLQEMQKNDAGKYRTFWREFGRVLKEGVTSDFDNKDRLLPLLLFPSSRDESELTTLPDYVSRMKPEQEEIYYLTGESRAQVEGSPHLEAFKEKGYEVLFLLDPVDELVVQAVPEFDGKKLKSAGKGTVELGTEEERKKAEEALAGKKEEFAGLMELLKKTLDEWVKEVRLSQRLTTSPACLVGDDFDLSPQLERLIRQTEGHVPRQKRILELNPEHEILKKMRARFAGDENDPKLADYAHLLLGYALLAEGSELPDPARFNRLVAELMSAAL
ncbi:MAG: molecular chaperone HtpG [Acidobacteria bacterium]|nr:MAG: molecular chaperone HtpG [Acidobacteriota bacterium]